MNLEKLRLKLSPWLIARIFAPLTFIVPLALYWLTLYKSIYPGETAALTAVAAKITQTTYLSNPLFTYISQLVAQIPYETLPVRLNLLSAICAATAVALFYRLVARIIFMLACEDSGGSMKALPPERIGDDGESKRYHGVGAAAKALSQNAVESVPEEVQMHNQRASYTAILGALGASAALAFSGPFWFTATRLYPHTFDLMLFFLVLNLVISYDQTGRSLTLLAAIFLLATCSVESALFLILAPIGILFLYRSMKLSEQFTTGKVLLCIIAGLSGSALAVVLLWNAASWCVNIEIPALRPLLNVFQATMLSEVAGWIPRYGWSRIFVLLLLPSILAFFVFGHSFTIRKPFLFLLQLLLVAMLIPSLLNMPFAPWGIARQISKVPVYSYVIIALITGLLIAVWHLMREMYIEKLDDELDFYEYRDNPFVCRVGSFLCWPLLLLALFVPFRSYTDIDPSEGLFTSEVAERLFQQLEGKKLVLDIPFLKHEILIAAHQHNQTLNLYSTSASESGKLSQMSIEQIKTDPNLKRFLPRLINAAEISPFSFMREWLTIDPQACTQIAVFSNPGRLINFGYIAVPHGFFMELLPAGSELDTKKLITEFNDFLAAMYPYMFSEVRGEIKLLTNHRNAYRQQLAMIGNELTILLIERKQYQQAADILNHCALLAPNNLSVTLNTYHLAKDLGVNRDTIKHIEHKLAEIPSDSALLNTSTAALQVQSGTLADVAILEFAKKRFWTKANLFKNLSINQSDIALDPILEILSKKRELYRAVAKEIADNELTEADSQLNILLDFDDKDHFALINKAKVAILQKNIPEAGLWMDLAKESAVPPAKLIWHEVALLMLTDKLDEARERLNEVIPDHASNSELWALLAEILISKGEFAELQSRVYPALNSASSNQEHYMFYVVRGYILKRRGEQEYVAARAAFLKALEINSNLPEVQSQLLDLDAVLGVPAFLEQDASKVLIDHPEHPRANCLMGRVRLSRNQLDLAEDFFVRSLAAEPTSEALAGLAETVLRQGDAPRAEGYIQQSLALEPASLETLHIKTHILLALNKVDQAAEAFSTVYAAKLNDNDVKLTMIRLLIKQDRLEEAAMAASNMLEQEDYLPRPIVKQLMSLAKQLSQELTRKTPDLPK
ncbi:MAG: hypothetical protein WC340_00420 [Kiritimatiellia bacterium]